MSNMSYCRFQNTNQDLAECQEALEELLDGSTPLSDQEMRSAISLVNKCVDIIQLVSESGQFEPAELLDRNDPQQEIKSILESANQEATETEEENEQTLNEVITEGKDGAR